MAQRLNEPVYRVLRAQAANIQRINEGLVLAGTDGQGSQIELWGPQPNVIRLYDTPMRFYEDAALNAWERIITLMPVFDRTGARFTGRADRQIVYQVQFLVRLTDREMARDREVSSIEGIRPDNPLAEKAHRLVFDWHHVFHDNPFLAGLDEDCPNGLVDDASYDMAWEPGVLYPTSLFTATITATRSAW